MNESRGNICVSCGTIRSTVLKDGGVCKNCLSAYGVTYGPDGWAIPNYVLLEIGRNADSFDRKVLEDRKRRSGLDFFKIPGNVLFSDAFLEIASDRATVTIYLMVLAKQPFPPKARERKKLEKAGKWPPPPPPFSFPLREAPHHGLTQKSLSRGLCRLHEVGLIDRLHAGSAMRKGDFATYIISERWRHWGKPNFEHLPWPKADSIGRRDVLGKFVRTRGRKAVAATSAATERELTAHSAATYCPVSAETAVNEGVNVESVACAEKYSRDQGEGGIAPRNASAGENLGREIGTG